MAVLVSATSCTDANDCIYTGMDACCGGTCDYSSDCASKAAGVVGGALIAIWVGSIACCCCICIAIIRCCCGRSSVHYHQQAAAAPQVTVVSTNSTQQQYAQPIYAQQQQPYQPQPYEQPQQPYQPLNQSQQ